MDLQGRGKFNDGKGKGDKDWGEEKGERKGDRKGNEKGKRNGDGRSKEKGEKGEKGDRGDRKGEGKGEGKGEKGGKGKREVKVVAKGLRGKIIQLLNGKPSGFIQRTDGEKDVFFDLADVEGEAVQRDDIVEFDIVEGLDKKLYGSKVKKLPKETDLKEESQVLKSTTVHMASKAGSLTGGGLSLGAVSQQPELLANSQKFGFWHMASSTGRVFEPKHGILKAGMAGVCALLLLRLGATSSPARLFVVRNGGARGIVPGRPQPEAVSSRSYSTAPQPSATGHGFGTAAPLVLLAGGASACRRRRSAGPSSSRLAASGDSEATPPPQESAPSKEPKGDDDEGGVKKLIKQFKEDPEFQEDVKTFFTSLTIAMPSAKRIHR
eukprot:symbB.v1.2.014383.t1/scaffold956.1/size149065/16